MLLLFSTILGKLQIFIYLSAVSALGASSTFNRDPLKDQDLSLIIFIFSAFAVHSGNSGPVSGLNKLISRDLCRTYVGPMGDLWGTYGGPMGDLWGTNRESIGDLIGLLAPLQSRTEIFYLPVAPNIFRKNSFSFFGLTCLR